MDVIHQPRDGDGEVWMLAIRIDVPPLLCQRPVLHARVVTVG